MKHVFRVVIFHANDYWEADLLYWAIPDNMSCMLLLPRFVLGFISRTSIRLFKQISLSFFPTLRAVHPTLHTELADGFEAFALGAMPASAREAD